MPKAAKKWRFALLLPLLALAGCATKSDTSSTRNAAQNPDSTTANVAVADVSDPNALTIISPNSADSQYEFERAFKAKFPTAKLKWIDMGGSSNDLSFVLSQFRGKPSGQSIGIDVFFGGGSDSFLDLKAQNLLQKLPSSYGIPLALNGEPLRDKDNFWVGAALSSFGILYNKTIMARDGLPVPQSWADLGNPKLRNRVSLADPRQSGSAHMAYEIVLQANGWDKGWQILTAMAGNARAFGKSSSGLLDDVTSGETVAAPAIDFYAANKIRTAGADKLGYVEATGQRVITADPIGILRDAPHQKMARDFVDFVMSNAGQRLWLLPKGAVGGPTNSDLGRQPALPELYKPLPPNSLISTNPYAAKNNFVFQTEKAALRRRVLDDLIGAVLIDNLRDVQNKTASGKPVVYVPAREDEIAKMAPKWDNLAFRNAQIGRWSDAARTFFQAP